MVNSKRIIALTSWCLCLFLVACTAERKTFVSQPIPENLLTSCQPNLPPPLAIVLNTTNIYCMSLKNVMLINKLFERLITLIATDFLKLIDNILS